MADHLEPIDFRPALPNEIEVARAIDDDACRLYAEHGLVIDTSTVPSFFQHETDTAGNVVEGIEASHECISF